MEKPLYFDTSFSGDYLQKRGCFGNAYKRSICRFDSCDGEVTVSCSERTVRGVGKKMRCSGLWKPI